MIDTPGIYALSLAEYLADPVAVPSLSASIARALVAHSPHHAWFEHPRLNPAYEREEDEKFDLGTAAHAYLLEGEAPFVIIDAADWRTKAAKEARDDARAQGKLPLLAHRWTDVQGMALAARQKLDLHGDPPIPFTNGVPEQTLIWKDGEVWCRARLDWVHHSGDTVDDLKTTSATANPEVWTRGPLFSAGYDLQAAFHLRGLHVLTGKDASFRFIVQENFPPYELSVIGLSPDALVLAEKKRLYAVAWWRACLAENHWPGYPARTCYADLPPWEEARWLEQELRETPVRDDGRPLADQLFGGES